MLSKDEVEHAAASLDAAERTRKQIGLLSLQHPGIDMDDAYAIQGAWVKKKIADGRFLNLIWKALRDRRNEPNSA